MATVTKILTIPAIIIGLGSCNNPHDNKIDKAGTHDKHKMSMTNAGYADSINSGLIVQDTMKSSPQRMAMATVGNTHLHITYHAPGVKGRVIWGGLVPYGTVWVTGAHTATSIDINKPIEINSKKIDAGTYAIFTIPGEKEWVFILNKNYQQHLADDYKVQEDVVRLTVKPGEHTMTPRLTYVVNKVNGNSGNITVQWEKLEIVVPFKTI